MNTHPNPLGEAGASAGRTATELAALAAMAFEQFARAHAARERQAADEIAEQEAKAATDLLADPPVLDPGWRADARLDDVRRAWHDAEPYASPGTTAGKALDEAEKLLRKLNPYAMGRYDLRRSSGMSQAEAMSATAGDFAWQGEKDAPVPAPGLTAADAEALQHALQKAAELNAKSVAKDGVPVDPQFAAAEVGRIEGMPAWIPGQIAEGLRSGRIVMPGSGQRSVANRGVSALNWHGDAGRHAGAARRKRQQGGAPRQADRRTTRTQARRLSPPMA